MTGCSVCRKRWRERAPGRPLLVWPFPGLLMGPLLMLYAARSFQVFWLCQEGVVCAAFACPDSIAMLAALGELCCKDEEGGLPEVMSSASHAGL